MPTRTLLPPRISVGAPRINKSKLPPKRIFCLESIGERSGCALNFYRLETLTTLKSIGFRARDTRDRRSSAR